MELFLFWIVISIIPAIIANKKGRSGIGWFFLSILISPLLAGTIAVALGPVEGGNLRKCPFCSEMAILDASVCRHCGNKLPKVEIMTDSSEKARLRNLWEKETDDKLKDAYIHKGFYRKLEYMGTGRKMQLILPIRPLWHLKTSGNLQNPILGFVCRWNDYANA